ncbi:MAG: hypothetical protein J6Q67_02810 [Clostridia bacterium]|nr:hypothetical protein [Clostridia bacterium]
MYDAEIMPKSLDRLIVCMCADYSRRQSVIENRTAPFTVIMEYRFLNYRMMNAALEIAGSRDALTFINDIGKNIGYAKTSLYALSESVYKERKEGVKVNIARRLSLF